MPINASHNKSIESDPIDPSAIIKGGDLYAKFANGNSMAPVAASLLIEELVADSNFPASVDEL